MEITPFLLSYVLPNEIVLFELYRSLWRTISPLTSTLRYAIVDDTCKYNEIMYVYTNIFVDNNEDGYCPREWIENDMLWILNDESPLMFGITDVLKKSFGSLHKVVAAQHVSIRLWRLMTDSQKEHMYQQTMVYVC